MERREPSPGATGTASVLVAESDLASSLSMDHSDSFPRVFATARMVAMMELAAARVLAPILNEGELSVGVCIDVKHTAATPEGATVRASARYLGRDGKFYRFEVTAEDEAGEIGRGSHQRAAVENARLLAGAERRRRA